MFQTTNQYKMHVYISRVVQLCLSIFCLCAVTYYMTDSTLLAIATCWATRLCSGRDSCWLDKTQRRRFWLDGVHLLQDPNRVGVPYFLKWGEASSKKGEGGQGFLLRLHRSPQEEEGRGGASWRGGLLQRQNYQNFWSDWRMLQKNQWIWKEMDSDHLHPNCANWVRLKKGYREICWFIAVFPL